MVAKSVLEELLNFPKLNSANYLMLLKLYMKMDKCRNTLKQRNRIEDLTAKSTIDRVVYKLPNDIIDRWHREVVDEQSDEEEPDFSSLMAFIDREAKVAQRKFNT